MVFKVVNIVSAIARQHGHVRPFVRATLPRMTERRDREADRRQFHA